MKTSFKTVWVLIAFSIAMGFLETAVVIYLRRIYYPEGFHLPLKFIDSSVAIVELLREAATLIMLITIAMLAGKSGIQRFAFFLMCFGVWDIFYYIFLKLFLNWPSSLLEGDVLFLIPLPWIGPVLAPCILSLTMIVVAAILLKKENVFGKQGIGRKNILLMIAGSCIVIFSFIINCKDYVLSSSDASTLNMDMCINYNWWLFASGEILIIIPSIFILRRSRNIG